MFRESVRRFFQERVVPNHTECVPVPPPRIPSSTAAFPVGPIPCVVSLDFPGIPPVFPSSCLRCFLSLWSVHIVLLAFHFHFQINEC